MPWCKHSYWLDNRNQIGVMQVPVVGRFRDRLGIFEAPEMIQGRSIVVRFTWDATNPERPRWEQAFSSDDGRTWETNWIADFTRADG